MLILTGSYLKATINEILILQVLRDDLAGISNWGKYFNSERNLTNKKTPDRKLICYLSTVINDEVV